MAVDLLFFGALRDALGRDGERAELPAEVATVCDLVQWLRARGEPERSALGDMARLRAAVDQRFATLNASLAGAREVALFPPVTGG